MKQLPDIEAFFKNFEAYREMNSVIRHHTNPQSVFLGPNLKKIDAIFKIEQLHELEEDLSNRIGRKIFLRKEQTGGRKYVFDEMNSLVRNKLIEITSTEYEYLKDFYEPPISSHVLSGYR